MPIMNEKEIIKRLPKPRGEDFWIRTWQWIALCSFFTGMFVSAMYYSQQVNEAVQFEIDKVREENPMWAVMHDKPISTNINDNEYCK